LAPAPSLRNPPSSSEMFNIPVTTCNRKSCGVKKTELMWRQIPMQKVRPGVKAITRPSSHLAIILFRIRADRSFLSFLDSKACKLELCLAQININTRKCAGNEGRLPRDLRHQSREAAAILKLTSSDGRRRSKGGVFYLWKRASA
jgi:hypothetical protein